MSVQDLPVVGIGASAGGLEPLQTVVSRLPADTPAAYVVVQHLSPDHRSIMDQLLQAQTSLRVTTIEDGERLEAGTVYVLPSGKEVRLSGRVLRLADRVADEGLRTPIDRFFESMAEECGRNGYCIVLSGSGSDGAVGLRAIKAAGGFAFAQEHENARFPGMPDSAIATGLVDFILRASDIPARLHEVIEYRMAPERGPGSIQAEIETLLPDFVETLNHHENHDFSGYKPGTLVRRIERRMSVLRIWRARTYVTHLRQHADEAARLRQDLLIGVTRFFRDPEVFELLRERVLVPLARSDTDPIRVWVPACSTGEEVYTIAMLLLDAVGTEDDRRIQVFGTDVDQDALIRARAGTYAAAELDDVPDRLRQTYFSANHGVGVANRTLREVCVFAPHDVVHDPPFSRVQLISCRNLLIYLNQGTQNGVIPRFHFALSEGGHLCLGPSESLSEHEALFDVVDKKARIFRKDASQSARYRPQEDRIPRPSTPSASLPATDAQVGVSPAPSVRGTRVERAERAFMTRFAQPFALVSAKGEVNYLSAAMAQLTRVEGGVPSVRIDGLLAEDLRGPVMRALDAAVESDTDAHVADITVHDGDRLETFDLTAAPVPGEDGRYLVVLHRVRVRGGERDDGDGSPERAQLQAEIDHLRRRLRAAEADHEASSQSLRASNEELLSMNEELQSANQEMETSREELQSINEELETVNAELSENNRQLTRANSDLRNLFESTDVATLFLDSQLCVRSFTPTVSGIISIRERDKGRPISDLTSRLPYPELEKDAEGVARTLQLVEREVTVESTDETFIVRLRPYRTTDDRLDGFVLTFFDITHRKRAESQLARNEESLRRQYAELENLYDTAPVGLALMDSERRWLRINERLAEVNGFPVQRHIGARQTDLIPDIDEKVVAIQQRVLDTGEPELGIEVAGYTAAQPKTLRHWVADYYPVKDGDKTVAFGACVREVTREKNLMLKVSASEARLRTAVAHHPLHFVEIGADQRVRWTCGDLAGVPGNSVLDLDVKKALPAPLLRALAEATAEWTMREGTPAFDVELDTVEGPRTYEVNVKPLVEEAGPAYLLSFFDISKRKSMDDQRQVLLAELQHRVKNTLATVSAVARFLATGCTSVQDYRKRITQRLAAIGRSHDILTAKEWRSARLSEIVDVESAPFRRPDRDPIEVVGQDLELSPREALGLGMAIHELVTNAAKYGALSVPEGSVTVSASEDREVNSALPRRIVWEESGGPEVSSPATGERGFGSFLIEQILAADVNGVAEIEYRPEGLRCTVQMPLSTEGDDARFGV